MSLFRKLRKPADATHVGEIERRTAKQIKQGVDMNMKVVIRGEQGAGKTSLAQLLVSRRVPRPTGPSSAMSVFTTTIPLSQALASKTAKLELWDVVDVAKPTSSATPQPDASTLGSSLYRNCSGVVLVHRCPSPSAYVSDVLTDIKNRTSGEAMPVPVLIVVTGCGQVAKEEREKCVEGLGEVVTEHNKGVLGGRRVSLALDWAGMCAMSLWDKGQTQPNLKVLDTFLTQCALRTRLLSLEVEMAQVKHDLVTSPQTLSDAVAGTTILEGKGGERPTSSADASPVPTPVATPTPAEAKGGAKKGRDKGKKRGKGKGRKADKAEEAPAATEQVGPEAASPAMSPSAPETAVETEAQGGEGEGEGEGEVEADLPAAMVGDGLGEADTAPLDLAPIDLGDMFGGGGTNDGFFSDSEEEAPAPKVVPKRRGRRGKKEKKSKAPAMKSLSDDESESDAPPAMKPL
eukprot:g7595.t1